MSALYWFALVVGAGMYLVSFVGDVDGADAEFDADFEAELDADFDASDAGQVAHGFRILSLRNATYFLFAFGVTGVLLTWLWSGGRSLLTALLASGLGLLGGGISAVTFGWLRRTESGILPGDFTWVGAQGAVTLPLSTTGTGKITVTRLDREHELLARPFDATAGAPETWRSVLVVEMRDGVALVAPGDASLEAADMPRLDSKLEN